MGAEFSAFFANTSGGGGGTPGGTPGQVQFNSAGSFAGLTIGGDGTLDTSAGTLTVTKTGGTTFGAAATLGIGAGLRSSGGNILLGDGAGVTYDSTNRALTIAGATLAAGSVPALVISQAWNNAATNFTGVQIATTVTAASGLSAPFRILAGAAGATNIFEVRSDGLVTSAGGIAAGTAASLVQAGVRISNAANLNFTNSSSAFGTADAGIFRNAAGILEVNTGTNGTFASLRLLNIGAGAAPATTTFVSIGAGTTAKSQINFASSTAPTSPVNGDFWFDGTNFKGQVGGATKTFTIV